MSALITVSPADLHATVARSCLSRECEPEVAERIARNVTFAEIHYGRSMQTFVVALGRDSLRDGPFASAPVQVAAGEAQAQAQAQAEGSTTLTFEPPVPLAAIAHELWEAIGRDIVPAGLPADVDGSTELDELRLAVLQVERDAIDAVVARTKSAHDTGLLVDRSLYDQLERAAGPELG